MLVVEFRVDSPILREALGQSPETTLVHEQQYQSEDGIVYLFWAEGGDLAAFDDALAADPTVTDPVELADAEGPRLYRVRFTDAGERAATFPFWSELNISFLDSTATDKGWEVRMRMPDRDALQRYREVCRERDIGFELQSLYENVESETGTVELTDVQCETLLAARELGYFEIPRRNSLADVADHLDVSSQAVSECMRRGTATLIDTVLDSENR